MRGLIVLCLAATGCRQLLGLDEATTGIDAPIDIATVDTVDASLGPWGTPVTVLPDAGINQDDDPTVTGDLLEMYFNRDKDIYLSVRDSPTSAWQAPSLVAELSDSLAFDTSPEVSADGLFIALSSERTGTKGLGDLMFSTRTRRGDLWGKPIFIPELSSALADSAGGMTGDLLEMAFTIANGTTADMFFTFRGTATDSWLPGDELTQLDTSGFDESPQLTDDGLTIVFDSDRLGNRALYVATRPTRGEPFGLPARIEELDTNADEEDPWISPDGHHLFFVREVSGVLTIVESTR